MRGGAGGGATKGGPPLEPHKMVEGRRFAHNRKRDRKYFRGANYVLLYEFEIYGDVWKYVSRFLEIFVNKFRVKSFCFFPL